MKKIRFGIVGCGAIAHTHALAISNMEGAELVAVASRTRDKDRGFAGKYACDFYTDFKKMLQRPDIDIINICTPVGCMPTWLLQRLGRESMLLWKNLWILLLKSR